MAKAPKKDTGPQNDSKDAEGIRAEFRKAVNMTASELEKWLKTDDSKRVGANNGSKGGSNDGGGESVGHKSGRRIVRILGTKDADLTHKDLAHMRKVIGYVKRHLAQRPSGDVRETDWRYSLMNWGHDPDKS